MIFGLHGVVGKPFGPAIGDELRAEVCSLWAHLSKFGG